MAVRSVSCRMGTPARPRFFFVKLRVEQRRVSLWLAPFSTAFTGKRDAYPTLFNWLLNGAANSKLAGRTRRPSYVEFSRTVFQLHEPTRRTAIGNRHPSGRGGRGDDTCGCGRFASVVERGGRVFGPSLCPSTLNLPPSPRTPHADGPDRLHSAAVGRALLPVCFLICRTGKSARPTALRLHEVSRVPPRRASHRHRVAGSSSSLRSCLPRRRRGSERRSFRRGSRVR